MSIQIFNMMHPFIKISSFTPINIFLGRNNGLAVCGPNGCGKTTFLKLLLKEQHPVRGHINIQENLAYLGVKNGLKPQLTLSQQLPFFMPDPGDFPWPEFLKRKYQDLSKGQQRLVALWIALHGSKILVLLDEPFMHLDVQNFLLACGWITTQLSRGKIIILTHHNPTELQTIYPLQVLDLNVT
ncbi:MAG: ATP-binding cassette domain-containing protein [Pseudomonadota bacterium]|jgi:ABC-type multidrug transport system ATPase subunit|nr:ATP-binding cassette domain-containing protein [Alphaproteobacteria bacterium]